MLLALRLSLEDLLRDLSRTLLSLVGLALVVASYFILSALSGAFGYYLENTDLSRNLIVIEKDVYDPADAILEPGVIAVPVELMPGKVKRVSPFVFRHTNINGVVMILRSADPADWEPVYHLSLVNGAWPGKADEIAADAGYSLANQWKIGSVLNIFGTPFRISGLYRAPSATFSSIWMPFSSFRDLFSLKGGYQALYVQVAAEADPEAVRAQLENDPRLAGKYAVYFEENYVQRNTQALKEMRSLSAISSLVALLGIVFGIFNAVVLSTVERGYEIGVLLGIGFSKQSIRWFMLLRVFMLVFMAYFVGLAIAGIYSTCQQAFFPLFIFGLPLNLQITPLMALNGLGLVVVLGMFGTWLSTRRFFSLRIVELLRER